MTLTPFFIEQSVRAILAKYSQDNQAMVRMSHWFNTPQPQKCASQRPQGYKLRHPCSKCSAILSVDSTDVTELDFFFPPHWFLPKFLHSHSHRPGTLARTPLRLEIAMCQCAGQKPTRSTTKAIFLPRIRTRLERLNVGSGGWGMENGDGCNLERSSEVKLSGVCSDTAVNVFFFFC